MCLSIFCSKFEKKKHESNALRISVSKTERRKKCKDVLVSQLTAKGLRLRLKQPNQSFIICERDQAMFRH